MIRNVFVVSVLAITLVPIAERSVAEGGAALPEEVHRALSDNATALYPVEVQWAARRQILVAPNVFSDLTTSDPRAFFGERWYRMAIDADRFYWSHDEPNLRREASGERVLVRHKGEQAFDGKLWYSGSGENISPSKRSLAIDTLENVQAHEPNVRRLEPDYLNYAGFTVPVTPTDFGNAPKSLLLNMLEHGGTVLDTRTSGTEGYFQCKIAWNDLQIDFTLDPKLRYAVRKRVEQSNHGTPLFLVTCSNFTQLDGERAVWLPRQCDVVSHRLPPRSVRVHTSPIYRETLTVAQLSSASLPNSRFSFKYDLVPGMLIADGRLPGSWTNGRELVSYQIPVDPDHLDAAIQAAIEGRRFIPPTGVAKSTLWFILFVAINIGVVVTLLGMWWWKRRAA